MNDTRASRSPLPISSEAMVLVLHGVAIFLALCWLWNLVRAQQRAEPYYGYDDGTTFTFLERVDVVTQTLHPLAYAGVVAGAAQILGVLTQRGSAAPPADAVGG